MAPIAQPFVPRKKRAIVGSVVKDFARSLRRFVTIGTEASVSELRRLTESLKSGITSLDDIVRSFRISRSPRGYMLMGEETVGAVHRLVREANLEGLARAAGSNVLITSAERAAFRQTMLDTPERALRDVGEAAATSAARRPHLNVTAEQVASLSTSGKRDYSKITQNLFKYFKQGTIVALTLGSVYVGVDWIAKTTERRKGCFMLTTIENKTSSCKVAAYSCIGSSDGSEMCRTLSKRYYNTTLVLMHIAADLPDTDQRKIDVAKAAGVPANELNAKLATVIDTKFAEVSRVIEEMGEEKRPTDFKICEIKHPNVEGGNVPPCRMCSPSDNPTSTSFIDSNLYAENITFQCSVSPTIIDTIDDAIISTGKNLWEGVTGALAPLKKWLIWGAVIVVVILALVLTVRLLPSRRNNSAPSYVPLAPPRPVSVY